MEHAIFYTGMLPIDLADQILGILSLGVAVCGAGILADRELIPMLKTDDFRLADIEQRADQRQSGSIQMCAGCKRIDASLEEQRQQ